MYCDPIFGSQFFLGFNKTSIRFGGLPCVDFFSAGDFGDNDDLFGGYLFVSQS